MADDQRGVSCSRRKKYPLGSRGSRFTFVLFAEKKEDKTNEEHGHRYTIVDDLAKFFPQNDNLCAAL